MSSSHTLTHQHIVALASMLALAACANQTPADPTANPEYVTRETLDETEPTDAEEQPAGDPNTDREVTLPDTPDAPDNSTYSQYIAFGDSFTSGFGLPDARSTTTCARSADAWPEQVNTLLQIQRPLIFAACSGATTLDVVGIGPLVGTKQPAPQIAELLQAEQLDSSLITIQIGGNDLRLEDSLEQCAEGLKALKTSVTLEQTIDALGALTPQCAQLDWLLGQVETVVNNTLEQTLYNTFVTVRDAAPNATIMAVGYPHLLDATDACTGFIARYFSTDYRERLNKLADGINERIRNAAKNARIFSVTSAVVTAFAGREACAPDEMISSANAHPNAAGHEAYARVVASAGRTSNPEGRD